MSPRDTCLELRSLLYAYRAGDCTPLQRTFVEEHLVGCESCQEEMRLHESMERTARRGPVPLSDAKKRALLHGIHERIASPTPNPWRQWLQKPQLWVPTGALAGAALVFLIVPMLGGLSPSLHPQGWLSQSRQVEAYLPEQATVAFSETSTGPVIELEEAAVLAHFHRLPGEPALQVRTPQLTAIIRGTVFFVEVHQGHSVVGVQSGTVEVRSNNGQVRLVGPGEQVNSLRPSDPSGSDLELTAADSLRFAGLARLFPPELPDSAPLQLAAGKPRRPRPKVATPRVSDASLPSPDPSVLARVVSEHLPALTACYEHALKNEPSLRGHLVLELRYNAVGVVEFTTPVEDELAHPEVTACLQRELKKLRFPAPEGGTVTLQLPLVFSPRGLSLSR